MAEIDLPRASCLCPQLGSVDSDDEDENEDEDKDDEEYPLRQCKRVTKVR
eukprot:CAMPEP_0172758824 /NCGR_PEP_ID=MMETSP1074-20121228/166505_1 /TAXON_ID=2916 /ORGANISM="Ceratium fusus, Strain PA161109" /LENGTH=49 /DNA_ID=CAMNT_0013592477 /DNA_START=366 /DNA_END=515 /DNA_ORIENTATION=+